MPKTRKNRNSRIAYLDFLRIASICFVMIMHIAAPGKNNTDIHSFLWAGKNFFNGSSRWVNNTLVMVSGSLFLSKDIPLITLYKKHILRIVRVFIMWSFAYAFIFDILGKRDIQKFVYDFAKGHFHMWFLYMIVGLYMIVPFFRKIVQDKALTAYFLVLSFIFAYIIPEAILLVRLASPDFANKLQTIINQMNFNFGLGMSFFFVLGYYLSHTELTKKYENLCLILGLFGFLITIF